MATAPGPESPARIPRWRRLLVGFLVVFGCVLAPISVLGVWVGGTLLDTDQWVSTVGPLASKPAVQQRVATGVTTALTEKLDLQKKISNALPKRASFLAPYVAHGLSGFVHDAALRFTESSRFQSLWNGLNRRIHPQVVGLLQGKGSGRLQTKNGQVVVGVDVKNNAARLVLLDSKSLNSVQGLVDLLNTLSTVLPILTVLVFAVAIWLSPRRRRTILRSGLGLALASAVVLVLLGIGRGLYLDALGPNVNRSASGDVYDQLLVFLTAALRTMFVLGAVIGIGAWLAGPGRYATRIREGVRGLVTGHAESGGEPSTVTVLAARYKGPLRVIAAGIGFVILVVLSHPGPIAVLVVAILVVAALLLIEFLASRAPVAPPETPEPPTELPPPATPVLEAAEPGTQSDT